MNIEETYRVIDPCNMGADLGLLKVVTSDKRGPHLATQIEVYTLDGLGLPDGVLTLDFVQTALVDPTAPRRFRNLAIVNDNGSKGSMQ